jgi:hypothetical protein
VHRHDHRNLAGRLQADVTVAERVLRVDDLRLKLLQRPTERSLGAAVEREVVKSVRCSEAVDAHALRVLFGDGRLHECQYIELEISE